MKARDSDAEQKSLDGSASVDSDVSEPVEADVWLDSNLSLEKAPEYKTWDKFDHDDGRPESRFFLTEAGPAAFDAFLNSSNTGAEKNADIVADASYAACLLALALGRGSLLFSWDTEKMSFVKTIPSLRPSGVSPQAIGSVDQICVECADATRQLKGFSEKTFAMPSTPTRVALAGAVDRLVVEVQSQLNARGRVTRSILQLQSVVRPAQAVLVHFRNLVQKLAQQKTDEGILSRLFLEAQLAEYQSSLLQGVTREVLRLVSKPWTTFVEEWVGLKAEEGIPINKKGPGRGFVRVADKMWIDDQGYELEEPDFFLDEENVPSFLPEDIAQMTFETGRNLRFLRIHHPDHPLSRQQTVKLSGPPGLDWQFQWDAIASLEARVNAYRAAVSQAIRDSHFEEGLVSTSTGAIAMPTDNMGPLVLGGSDTQIAESILDSISRLNQPLEAPRADDGLSALIRDRLYEVGDTSETHANLAPHWMLIPVLSFGPVISTQSELVNQEVMKVMFRSHELRVHLDLLKQYYLLDNGLLCSRLSHALFDPEMETAERKAGVALGGGAMGLRLGGRENWPPASSELRLALMGVLAESYQSPAGTTNAQPVLASRTATSDLPGDLSFAVRDLTSEEIDRCLDPDGLEALDFLRLSYKAPSPLRPVITPTVLVKYDRIFMALLRVLRMLYVVNELFHDIPLAGRRGQDPSDASLRFCIEARHFVRQIAAYFFDTGVTMPRRRFEAWLDVVEKNSLGTDGETPEPGSTVYSPDVVRDRQEQHLDEIMTVLLLRKRQAPVLKLLEDIFSVVLRFARQLRLRARTRVGRAGEKYKGEQTETPEKLYGNFRKKVELFLTVCRGLGEKTGPSSKNAPSNASGQRAGESSIEQLLLMLDMMEFYDRK